MPDRKPDMDTEILGTADSDLKRAADLLRSGEIVAIPTETVYGLAGNALDPLAAGKIYSAKGRPSDNPLIVHISDTTQIYDLVKEVPEAAKTIFREFAPGPVTVVLPKADIIPDATSGGLDTVGIRLPANRYARRIIELCGFPLAAPSANLSGSPSPTSSDHVKADMTGRIAAIVDGGVCGVGVESTVLSVCGDDITVLRPGFVTPDDLIGLFGTERVHIAKGVTERIADGERVLSPGMKYRHYAPDADIAILKGNREQFEEYVNSHADDDVYAMVFGDESVLVPVFKMGMTADEQAHTLFDILRELDNTGAKRVYARCPATKGIGLAVYNRLLRAAGFEVIEL